MSNSLAVAAVTATLRAEIDNAFQAAAVAHPTAVQNAHAFAGPPGQNHGAVTAGVDVYLYRVGPNPALRNHDAPTRGGNGRLVDVPMAALTLWYLLSFFGDEDDLEPQQLLGVTTAHLHSQPILTPTAIAAATAAVPALTGADLDEQPEYVRMRLVPMAEDDLNRIWSMLPAGTFALALVYEASVVLVEPDVLAAQALPVLQRGITVLPGNRPLLRSVLPAAQPTAPIVPGTELLLRGRDLSGPGLRVEFDGVALPSAAILSVANDLIRITVAPTARAGVRTVQVVHERPTGVGPATLPFRSDAVPVVVRPVVASVTAPASIVRVNLTVAPALTQQLAVVLNDTATGASFVLPATLGAPPTRLEADRTGVPTGTYVVQARVDGVASVPTGPPNLPLNAPSVAIP